MKMLQGKKDIFPSPILMIEVLAPAENLPVYFPLHAIWHNINISPSNKYSLHMHAYTCEYVLPIVCIVEWVECISANN